MSNISTPRGNRFNGWFTDNSVTGTPVQKLFNNGVLVTTVTGANAVPAGTIAVSGTNIVSAVLETATGDTNTYQEDPITSVLTALALLGIITDSTT